jgi:hypothetical protein
MQKYKTGNEKRLTGQKIDKSLASAKGLGKEKAE